jgi:membrane associated rhomboid family serine protease
MQELKTCLQKCSLSSALGSLKNVPYATIGFIVLNCLIFWFGLLSWVKPNSIERLLLHPFIHADLPHIVGNLVFGVVVVGTLIESWMMKLRRIVRYGILVYSYLISLTVVAIWWLKTGVVLVGSSGVILAGLAVAVAYYQVFHNQLTVRGWNALGPVGVGFGCAFLAQFFLRGLLGIEAENSFVHVSVFALSFLVLCVVDNQLDREQKAKLLQAS